MRCGSARIGCWRSGSRTGCQHFRIDLARLGAAADLVVETTREAYPTLDVPFHSRWRHFVVGGEDRWAAIDDATPWRDAAERARAAFDLAIISVLLDAGAGPQWSYRDADRRRQGRPIRGPGARQPCHVRAWRILRNRAVAVARRCRGARNPDRRSAAPPLPGDARTIRWRASKAARRCCAGSVPRSRQSLRSSRAPMRRVRVACSTIWPRWPPDGHRRACHPRRAAAPPRRRYGPRASSLAASPWATAGAIRR